MKTIGIYYGSSTGTTKAIAEKIAQKLNVKKEDVHNVANTEPSTVGKYDVLLMGTSTWGNGELQDDWYDFLAGLEALDLKGKEIGLFGCGDESMSDTFNDAVGLIYDKLKETGATFIGSFDSSVYNYTESDADKEHTGIAVGLLLDEVNEPQYTDKRIDTWVSEIRDSLQ